MQVAGVRAARQNLSVLIDEVRKGHEILITERGKPVARLVPAEGPKSKPYRSHAAFRRSIRRVDPPVSLAIIEEREDRI